MFARSSSGSESSASRAYSSKSSLTSYLELRQHRPDLGAECRGGPLELGSERRRRCRKSTSQLLLVERSNERRLERREDLLRQEVCALRVSRDVTEPQTGERDHVVADATDRPLGLPRLPAFDACLRVPRVDPRETNQFVLRRRSRRDVDGFPEHRSPVRPARTEISLRRERNVDLQPVGQQEDAVDRRSPRKIPVVDRGEIS